VEKKMAAGTLFRTPMAGEGDEWFHRKGFLFRHILPNSNTGDAPVLPASRLHFLKKIHTGSTASAFFPPVPDEKKPL
jgi:hypothetical protein